MDKIRSIIGISRVKSNVVVRRVVDEGGLTDEKLPDARDQVVDLRLGEFGVKRDRDAFPGGRLALGEISLLVTEEFQPLLEVEGDGVVDAAVHTAFGKLLDHAVALLTRFVLDLRPGADFTP
mgnify:CR=1 FL=1